MPVNVNGVACTLAGGVRETTQTTGTGSYTVDGAATVDGITYRSAAIALGNGVTSVWTVRLGAEFETFIGTITTGPSNTISRDSILESSNSNNAVNWGAGIKDIICDMAAAVAHSLQTSIDTTVVGNFKITNFTSNDTWSRDAKCLFAKVRVQAGGGGGGGTSTTGSGESAEGSGGGAGEYAEGWFTAAQLGSSQSVTVGVAGTGVAGATGNTGGNSSFGSLITCNGGTGGGLGDDVSIDNTADGGIGGTGGTGGSFRMAGEGGARGRVFEFGTGSVRLSFNPEGGNSFLGRGAGHSSSGAAGDQAPQGYGAGGSGAINGQNNSQKAGGNGSPGLVIVEEFLSL